MKNGMRLMGGAQSSSRNLGIRVAMVLFSFAVSQNRETQNMDRNKALQHKEKLKRVKIKCQQRKKKKRAEKKYSTTPIIYLL